MGPAPIKAAIHPLHRALHNAFADKYRSSLAYWDSRLERDDGVFRNSHYEKRMLGMAEEPPGPSG